MHVFFVLYPRMSWQASTNIKASVYRASRQIIDIFFTVHYEMKFRLAIEHVPASGVLCKYLPKL